MTAGRAQKYTADVRSSEWPASAPCRYCQMLPDSSVTADSIAPARLTDAPSPGGPDYESGGQRFESFRARQSFQALRIRGEITASILLFVRSPSHGLISLVPLEPT